MSAQMPERPNSERSMEFPDDEWLRAGKLPEQLHKLFQACSVPGVNDAEIRVPPQADHTTPLPGRGGPPFADWFVKAQCSDGLITVIVEEKVDKTLYTTVGDWIPRSGNRANRELRLKGLCNVLEVDTDEVIDLQYQFIHRTAAAVIDAQLYSAKTAVMLVRSFSSEPKWFDLYAEFGKAMGVTVVPGQLVDAGYRSDRRLLLGWLSDSE